MPPVDSTFYDALDLPHTATTADVRKAYKKLAMKWHPDKHPPERQEEAKMRFQAVAEAYETLSDDKKRRAYDKYGPEGQATPTPGGFDGGFDDGFAGGFDDGFAGGFDDFGGFAGRSRRPRGRSHRRAHMSFAHAQDIFDAFFGGRDPFAAFDDMMADMGMGTGAGGLGFGADPFGMLPSAAAVHSSRRGRPSHRSPLSSMLADPFAGFGGGFDDGFGGGFDDGFGGGFGGHRGGASGSFHGVSTSSSTVIRNGKAVTTTRRVVRHPDGRVEEDEVVTEDDAPVRGSIMDDFGFGGGRRGQRGGRHDRLGYL